MKVGMIVKHPPDSKTYKSSDDLVLPNVFIGVEVELEEVGGLSTSALSSLWEVKGDGSLHRDGMEYVFSEPLFGQDVITALKELDACVSSYVATTKAKVVDQNTSVHIHIDARDVETNELERWCKLYWMYEGVLFDYISKDRSKNPFCFPLKETRDAILYVWTAFDALSRRSASLFNNVLSNFQRYSGLNLAALSSFGSLEFRGHPGSYNAEAILEWINILLCLRAAASNEQLDHKRPYLALKEFGMESVTRMIFGKYADSLLSISGFNERLEEGKNLVRYITNNSLIVQPLEEVYEFNEFKKKVKGENREEVFAYVDDLALVNDVVEDPFVTELFYEEEVSQAEQPDLGSEVANSRFTEEEF
jgi:hypothetical protein